MKARPSSEQQQALQAKALGGEVVAVAASMTWLSWERGCSGPAPLPQRCRPPPAAGPQSRGSG